MVESSFRKGVVIACMIEYALTFHLCNAWDSFQATRKLKGEVVSELWSNWSCPSAEVSTENLLEQLLRVSQVPRKMFDMMWKTGSPGSFVAQVCCSKPWLTQQLWELLSTLDASEASQYRIAQPTALFCGLSIGWIPQRVPGQLCHNRDDGWFVLKWCKT